jgi:hypothetical protein
MPKMLLVGTSNILLEEYCAGVHMLSVTVKLFAYTL